MNNGKKGQFTFYWPRLHFRAQCTIMNGANVSSRKIGTIFFYNNHFINFQSIMVSIASVADMMRQTFIV